MSNVSVPIIVDSVSGEKNEEFDLTLNVSPFLAPAITAGSRDRVTGVIIDTTSKNFVSHERVIKCMFN